MFNLNLLVILISYLEHVWNTEDVVLDSFDSLSPHDVCRPSVEVVHHGALGELLQPRDGQDHHLPHRHRGKIRQAGEGSVSGHRNEWQTERDGELLCDSEVCDWRQASAERSDHM